MCLNFVDLVIGSDLSNINKARVITSAINKESLEAIIEAITINSPIKQNDFSILETLQYLYNQAELDPEADLEYITVWRQYLTETNQRCNTEKMNGIINADWIAHYITPEEMQKWLDSGVFDPSIICDLWDAEIYPQNTARRLSWFQAKKLNILDFEGYQIGELICRKLLTIAQAQNFI